MRNSGFGNMTKYRSLGIAFNYENLLKKMQADEPQNIVENNWYNMATGEIVENKESAERPYHCNVIRRVLGTNWKYNQIDQIVLNLNTMHITISYYGTTLAKFYPDNRVLFAKLWNYRDEKETKKRLDFIANGNGGTVYQKDFTWYLACPNTTVKFGVCSYNLHSHDSLLDGVYEEIARDDTRYPKPPEYWN